MRVSERQTSTPVGLSRFLVTHREHDGFEALRDSSLVTVICSGCEASFSYLRLPEDEAAADVEAALAQLSGQSRTEGPRGDGGPDAPRRRAKPAAPDAPPAPETSSANGNGAPPATAKRLAPPGPHAPRRRRNPTVSERVVDPVREGSRRAIGWAAPRRRAIVLTILALAGAYLFISLSLGDDASSSSEPSSPPPADPAAELVAPTAESESPPAVPDEGPMAEGARPLSTFESGGPNVQDQAVPAARFAVAMPPDWTRQTTADGSTRFAPDDGGGEVVVVAQPRGAVSYGQMTDEAAGYIADRVEAGTAVARPAWRWVGNLLSVAVASEPDGHSEIAYIGVTPETRYLVVRSIEPHASALVRLQADGIVTSFTAQ